MPGEVFRVVGRVEPREVPMSDIEITLVIDEENLPLLEEGQHLNPPGYQDVWFRLDKQDDGRYRLHANGAEDSPSFAAAKDTTPLDD